MVPVLSIVIPDGDPVAAIVDTDQVESLIPHDLNPMPLKQQAIFPVFEIAIPVAGGPETGMLLVDQFSP